MWRQAAAFTRAAVLVAVLASALIAVVVPGWLAAHQTAVLAGGFLLGLPHGAVDHVLPARHGWVRRGPWGLLVVALGYLALAGLTWVGLRLAGPVVLPLLLVVSVLHFGAADLTGNPQDASRGLGWRRSPSTQAAVLFAAVARGGPVVAGPLLAWTVPTGAALAAVGLGAAPAPALCVAVGAVLLAVSVGYVVLALIGRRPADAAEVALLVALFVVAPPLAAFGVYFGLWHGLRHTARLLADDPANAADLAAGRVGRPLLRFARVAAVPTAAALVTVVVLVVVVAGHGGLAGPVFAALLALTVPHVVVVAGWDAAEQRAGYRARVASTSTSSSRGVA